MERRANPGEKRREGTSLLRGIMHCGVCGERMYTFSGCNGQLRYRCIGPLKYRRTAKPGGVKAEPTGETHAEQWKRSDVAGKRDLLLNAGGYVEVAPARRGGKKLDTSRLSVHFGEEGHMRRAAAAKESEQETEAADSQG
ncbi:zinc ribbon domain-containing protein [Streptomyces sp. NPDC056188]|uniref:zinc ribbon domain-containing protein n=1 Tax=Streptomyces sp. NPDC056188 TaxID=3345740 RepID=UPI0035D57C12